MGNRNSLGRYRSKTRKVHGNQFTEPADRGEDSATKRVIETTSPSSADGTTNAADTENDLSCSSAKKLRLSFESDKKECDDYYILMSFSILQTVVGRCKCEFCQESLDLVDNESFRAGLAHKLSLQCRNCGILDTFYSSPVTCNVYPDSKARRSMFAINLRSVLAFRKIGKGHKAMNTFSGFMNLSKPLSKTQYDKANEKLLSAYQDACIQSCKEAALETINKLDGSSDAVTDCQVFVDGTWQKCGHSSLTGVVTVMSKENGKCLDHIVLSKAFKGCQTWSNRTNHPEYNSWLANHD